MASPADRNIDLLFTKVQIRHVPDQPSEEWIFIVPTAEIGLTNKAVSIFGPPSLLLSGRVVDTLVYGLNSSDLLEELNLQVNR